MDKPFLNIRGWDLGLEGDITMAAEKKAKFSLLIGKFLMAAECRGWWNPREYDELVRNPLNWREGEN